MLPQHRDEDEDRGDEYKCQRGLRDWSGRERFDVSEGTVFFVVFFVPTGEGGEEDEADEGEDYGDDSMRRGWLVRVLFCGDECGTYIR